MMNPTANIESATATNAGFKQTEVGWIPVDWEVRELGEVGAIKMCRRIFNHQTKSTGAIPFYKIGTFGRTPDAFIDEDLYHEYKRKYSFPEKGEILVSASGTIGRTVIYDGSPAYYQDSNIIWIANKEGLISNEFLYHIYQVAKYGTEGGTIQRLYNDVLNSTKFICPPSKSEQTAIATALSDMDALIQAQEELLAKKRALKQGAMQELLTGKRRLVETASNTFKQTEVGRIPVDWEVVNLIEIGESLAGLTYSPHNVKPFGTLVLRSSNIQNGRLAFNDNVFVEMDLPERVIVKEGDILICVRNGSKNLIGKCALIDKKTAGSAFGAFMSVFRSDIPEFAFFMFQSNVIQRQINQALGATINQITNKDLASFLIPLPPTPAEQTAIAAALSNMDTEIKQLEAQLTKYRQLKVGMMQELLTGKKRLV